MILLDTDFTDILMIPVFLLILYGLFKVFLYMITGMSKLSGKRLYVNGQKWSDPHTFDLLVEHDKKRIKRLKEITFRIKEGLKQSKNNINTKLNIDFTDKTTDKIQKIQTIKQLYEVGAITDEEFDFLKKEILQNEPKL